MDGDPISGDVMVKVRSVLDSDIIGINRIYNHFVENSNVTLDLDPWSKADGMDWLRHHQIVGLPILVAEVDDVVQGWIALSKLSAKPGYDRSAEVSIYVSPDSQRNGIGNGLFEMVLHKAEEIGLHCLMARISSDNLPSISFFENHAFDHVGVEREIGIKFDKFIDVIVMQRLLGSAR